MNSRFRRGAKALTGPLLLLLLGAFCATAPVLATAAAAEAPQDTTASKPLFLAKPSHEEMKAKAEDLERQVAADSLNYELNFELAGIYYDMGSLLMAAKYYGKAVDLDPTSVRALVNYGVVLNEMGRSDEAIDVYDRALEINPEDTKAICNRGLAYYGTGRYPEAVKQYELALKIDPNSLEAHYNLGVAFADAQIYREAINEWKKVVEIDPDSDAARAAKANIEVIQQLIDFGGDEKE